MRKFSFAIVAMLLNVSTVQVQAAEKADIHATLAYAGCVAKLLNQGLGPTEARQLCLDTSAN